MINTKHQNTAYNPLLRLRHSLNAISTVIPGSWTNNMMKKVVGFNQIIVWPESTTYGIKMTTHWCLLRVLWIMERRMHYIFINPLTLQTKGDYCVKHRTNVLAASSYKNTFWALLYDDDSFRDFMVWFCSFGSAGIIILKPLCHFVERSGTPGSLYAIPRKGKNLLLSLKGRRLLPVRENN